MSDQPVFALPADAVLWANKLDLSKTADPVRGRAGQAAAAFVARAAEMGLGVFWTNNLGWMQAVAEKSPLAHVWAPLRAHHWPDYRDTTAVLALAPNGGGAVLATICVRRLWIEDELGAALASQFGTNAYSELLAFAGDLARDVRDCHIAWACGLWRADLLRGARIGGDLIAMAAIDALARWRWSWFLGLRREQAQHRLGLGLFDRLEAPVVDIEARQMMLVAARRARVRAHLFEGAGA